MELDWKVELAKPRQALADFTIRCLVAFSDLKRKRGWSCNFNM